MSVFVVGLNHRSAPLATLERVGIPEPRLVKALAELKNLEHLQEAVVISTCNRIEIYAFAETFHGAYENVREFLAEFSYTPLGDFASHLYSLFGLEAVEHLFKVVSGLDSAVLGEVEIQGQVKRAWEAAQREELVGSELNLLFRHGLEAGKKVRSNTRVGTEKISSVCGAAVALAQKEFGSLVGKKALMLGTGEVGQTGARILSELDMAEVSVASRTWQRANHLAESVGGRAVHLDELTEALEDADFLFTATGATSLILERSEIATVMERRGGRKLVAIDLAVPRDIDPTAAGISGLKMIDLEDIQQFAEAELEGSLEEIHRAQAIVAEEVGRYSQDNAASSMTPLIVDFRRKICDISQLEFDKFESELASLNPDQRESVEALVHSIVNKVLHHPTVRIKESSEAKLLGTALRELFDLEGGSQGLGAAGSSGTEAIPEGLLRLPQEQIIPPRTTGADDPL